MVDPLFDASAYEKRNVVERGYLHLKQWRGIATRYDKHARTFLGGVQLASTILHLKRHLASIHRWAGEGRPDWDYRLRM